jgi:hypothetical protein
MVYTAHFLHAISRVRVQLFRLNTVLLRSTFEGYLLYGRSGIGSSDRPAPEKQP